jgi:hypothetical protein
MGDKSFTFSDDGQRVKARGDFPPVIVFSEEKLGELGTCAIELLLRGLEPSLNC